MNEKCVSVIRYCSQKSKEQPFSNLYPSFFKPILLVVVLLVLELGLQEKQQRRMFTKEVSIAPVNGHHRYEGNLEFS